MLVIGDLAVRPMPHKQKGGFGVSGWARFVVALRVGGGIQVRCVLGYSAASGFAPATDPTLWLA